MRIHNPHIPLERMILGQVLVSTQPRQFSTILGSCIAACIFDPEAQIGGMNHFLLPESLRGEGKVNNIYGVHAMETLVTRLLSVGAAKHRLRAKLFGGCNTQTLAGPHWQAGAVNQEFAVRELQRLNIPLVAHSLGGRHGRQICMATHSGDVRMRALGSASAGRWTMHGKHTLSRSPSS